MSQTNRVSQAPPAEPFNPLHLPTGLTALVALIFVVGILIAVYITTGPHPVREPTMSDLAAIEAELSSVRNEVTVLQQTLDALSQTSSDVAMSSRLAQVRSELDLLALWDFAGCSKRACRPRPTSGGSVDVSAPNCLIVTQNGSLIGLPPISGKKAAVRSISGGVLAQLQLDVMIRHSGCLSTTDGDGTSPLSIPTPQNPEDPIC